jgi:hypothetical protein
MLIPAYNRDNLLCGGVLEHTDAGLSALGRHAVEECDRVGVVLDASHVSRRASLEMIDASANPIVFSHANPKALVDNPRNVDDEQIKAVAARGGVIGTVNWGPLIFRDGMTARPTVHDYLDHVDYLAEPAGHHRQHRHRHRLQPRLVPRHTHDKHGPYYKTVMTEMNEYVDTYWRGPERFAEGFATYPEIVDVTGCCASAATARTTSPASSAATSCACSNRSGAPERGRRGCVPHPRRCRTRRTAAQAASRSRSIWAATYPKADLEPDATMRLSSAIASSVRPW